MSDKTRQTHRVTCDGVTLQVYEHAHAARADAPVCLALHGFTGDGLDFAPLATRLRHARWLAPDLIGHGLSDAPEALEPYTMRACVEQLIALLDALSLPQVVVLGYSMGGRVALQLATHHPERVSALIAIGATPGLEGADARAARVAHDEALAARIEAIGAAAFLEEWQQGAIIATQRRMPARWRAVMQTRRASARALGLANSLRGMGTGAMAPCWGALSDLTMPVTLMTGEQDEKFCEIARQMGARVPHARHHTLRGAGHACHLERPDAALEVLDRALLP